MIKAFVKYNRKTKTFTASHIFTHKIMFKNVKKIPLKKEEVIIYQGNGNNIHHSLWSDDWFE